MVPFRIHSRRSKRYRDKSAFIAGDAAHIQSPAGGQGMNTGIQDAYNLAWKLALVVRGGSEASLLDSYEAEREPIAKSLLAATDVATRALQFVATLENRFTVALRNQIVGFATGLDVLGTKVSREVSMLELRYRDSPIVGQDRPSIWSTDVVHSGRVEAPALADWAAFGDGSAPGDRAPEVVFGEGAAGWSRMGDVLRGPKHALLLFDGAAATAEGYRNLAAIAGHIEKSYGDVIAVHVIVPSAEKPEALAWSGSMVLDADDAVHRRYGARSECLYLIRPDGYLAYRCQPASDEKLGAYLQAIYKSAQ